MDVKFFQNGEVVLLFVLGKKCLDMRVVLLDGHKLRDFGDFLVEGFVELLLIFAELLDDILEVGEGFLHIRLEFGNLLRLHVFQLQQFSPHFLMLRQDNLDSFLELLQLLLLLLHSLLQLLPTRLQQVRDSLHPLVRVFHQGSTQFHQGHNTAAKILGQSFVEVLHPI